MTNSATLPASASAAPSRLSALDGWIDVCRVGAWRDMENREVRITEDQLDSIVSNYAAGDPAPIVVGHPETDDPAYGWVDSIRRVGDRLQARLRDIEPAFRELVEGGRYANRSVALLDNNLIHLGFLGGARPAVSGLAPTQFSSRPDTVIEFAATMLESPRRYRAFRVLGGVFRRLRERIIAQDGLEAADGAISEYDIDAIGEAGNPDPDEVSKGILSEGDDMSEEEKTQLAADRTALDAEKTQLAADRVKLNEEKTRLAEANKEAAAADRRRQAETTLKPHVEAGRILPAEAPALTELFASLPEDDAAVLTFAAPEGSGESEEKVKPREVLSKFFAALPKRITYNGLTTGENLPGSPDEDKTIPDRAKAYQAKLAASGSPITASEAVRAVRENRDKE